MTARIEARSGVIYGMREFVAVYRLYRHAHSIPYALKTAWRIAVRGADF